MEKNDLTLLTDLYQLTMMQGYQEKGLQKKIVVFDLFYRKNPSGNGYAIVAGLEQAIEYINQLHFSKQDIDYLKSLNIFSDNFIDYLKENISQRMLFIWIRNMMFLSHLCIGFIVRMILMM